MLRDFAGESLDFEGVPYETTILKFRHLLEKHALGEALFDEMVAILTARGLLLAQGTIVDATLTAAPPSTRTVRVRAATVSIIKEKLADQLVNGIKYEKDGTWYEQTQFKDVIDSWEDYIVRSAEDQGIGGTSLYDGIEWDSDIERNFVLGLEKRSDVKLYIKLPKWFSVDTPVGKYDPDWAVVMHEQGDGSPVLYLVRETKSTLDQGKYRPDERRKITSGRNHFKALSVDFQVVTSTDELPSGGV